MMPRHHVLGALFLLLLLLAGCGDSSSKTTPDDFMVDVDSPVHDIRQETLQAWANSNETFSVMPLTLDREGWSCSWRVGGGEILGSADSSAVIWRTPLDTLSWIEATLNRGHESHLCRRWIALWLEPLTVTLLATQIEPAATSLACSIGSSPRAPLTFRWGADEGTISPASDGRSAHWNGYSRIAGAYRVWVLVDDGLRQASDTLSVSMRNIAPHFGPDFGSIYEDWHCGARVDFIVRGADDNWDPLTLQVLSLEDLELEGMEQFPADSSAFIYYQTYWVLGLRDIGAGQGTRSIQLRLSDGSLSDTAAAAFLITCP